MCASHSGSRPYIIVGTSYAIPNEDEPSMGQLSVFETTNLVTNRSNDSGEMDSGGGTLGYPRVLRKRCFNQKCNNAVILIKLFVFISQIKIISQP